MILTDYQHCTCCSACSQICPKQCISIVETEDGFLFPSVDKSLCIDCGRCDVVCPIDKNHYESTPTAFGAVARQKSMLEKATSGGIFGAIAENVLIKGGVVYGCAFTGELKAKHIRIDSIDELSLLYGSKYVQSNIDNSFVSVKKDLNMGRWVVFSGTPCQIAGLRYYLGKPYDHLILVDIVCHGVPSQAYFDKYSKWLETRERGQILDYQFRSKKNHGWSLAGEYTIQRQNRIKRRKLFYFEHYYYYYFLESSIYRECCYSCKYSNMNREGDFTLGDLWGAEALSLGFDISRGCSLLLVNTDKARNILEELDIIKTQIPIETAMKHNEQLLRPSKRHPERNQRIKAFQMSTGNELQREFLTNNFMGIMKGKIKYLIPASLVRLINRIRFNVSS